MNGAQGSGKSTLARFLQLYLEKLYGLSVVILSLDDLYLTRAERIALAEEVHPLLKTRGVRVRTILAWYRFYGVLSGRKVEDARCPRFDKANDDRKPSSHWLRFWRKHRILFY